MFKFVLKFLAWGITVILGLALIIYVVLRVVNLHDQPPSELAKNFQLQYDNREKVADQDNAFVLVMGFAVNKNENPKEVGAKRIALIENATDAEFDEMSDDLVTDDYSYRDKRSSIVEGLSSSLQAPFDEKVYSKLEQNNEVILEWKKSESWLLDRYLDLLNYRQYREYVMTNLNMPLPKYGDLMEGQKLFLLNLWLEAEQGNAENVKKLLDLEATYWRMALASSDMLISKIIATVSLKRHFVIGNLILKKLSEKSQVNVIPENWQTPFTKAELSMLRVFIGEWVFSDKSIRNTKNGVVHDSSIDFVDGDNNWMGSFTYFALQPQDSSNKHAQNLKMFVDTFNVPLNKYPAALNDIKSQSEINLAFEKRIYNFVGNMLTAIALTAYSEYPIRVADLEGVRRAAALASELRFEHTPDENIKVAIKNSKHQNPYTDNSFEWDSKSKSIKFTGLEEGERGSYTFLY